MSVFTNHKGLIIHVPKNIYFINSYDSDGVPANLNYDPDGAPGNTDLKKTITSEMTNDINACLPERQRLQERHPDWIQDSDIHIVKDNTQITLTYINEGAGYKNGIGYYIYNTNDPPRKLNDIKVVFVVYPNFSGSGKGGMLVPGDSVKLPSEFTISNPSTNIATPTSYNFSNGKSIGFVLFANAWRAYKGSLNRKGFKYYSNSRFNPESTPDKRKHMVLIQSDIDPNAIIFGFEDLNRDGNSDDDFNDAIILLNIESDISHIDSDNIARSTQVAKGTIIMDDQNVQQSYVDNDFSDLITEYNFTKTLSGANIVSIIMDFDFKHRSSLYDHKFGLLINNISNYSKSVQSELFIGTSTTPITNQSYFSGDRLYVITSTKTVLPGTNGSPYANTAPDWEISPTPSSTCRVVITFNEDVTDNNIGLKMPFLPFLEVYTSGDSSVGESYIIEYNDRYLSTNRLNMIVPLG